MVATRRRFNPNLQRVRILLGGTPTRAYVCTRCLKAGKVEKAVAEVSSPFVGDVLHLRKLVDPAAAAMEASRRRIDDLNVYPVPDGDTGTNLTLTVRAVKEALDKLEESDRERLAHADRARRADGRPRQLGRDPVADRPRLRRGDRRDAGDRLADARPGVPLRERRRVPRGARATGGDDADGDPRARGRGGGAGGCAAGSPGRRPAAGGGAPRRGCARAHAGVPRDPPPGGCRRRRRRGAARARPRCDRRTDRRGAAGAAGRARARRPRRRPPGALASTATAPSSSSRARGSTSTGSRTSWRSSATR